LSSFGVVENASFFSQAKLVPTDDITIYYSVEPQTSEIARVAVEQRDEIEALLKKPFMPLSSSLVRQENVVIKKKLPVSSIGILRITNDLN